MEIIGSVAQVQIIERRKGASSGLNGCNSSDLDTGAAASYNQIGKLRPISIFKCKRDLELVAASRAGRTTMCGTGKGFWKEPPGAGEMLEGRVSPRERLVLTAIIELYIATGEPVASQAVAQVFASKEGLSSATIRNVMATLGDAGLLDQPHTSAGRVPTAAAFRYYVEQITRSDAPMGRGGYVCFWPGHGVTGTLDSERRAAGADRGQLLGGFEQQRLSGAHFACAGADIERSGRCAGQCCFSAGAGAYTFFKAFGWPCACGAGDAVGRGAGPGVESGSRADASGTRNGRALSERELSRLAH